MDIRLPNRWQPRPYQAGLWQYLEQGGARAVVCAHRRWGKDDVSLHHTACAMMERRGNYGHMLPEYAQGRKAIWDAVNPHTGKRRIDEAFPLEIRHPTGGTNNQEMKITTQPDGNGNVSTWQVVGSDNYNSLMGTAYAGIVKSEEALSDPSAWAYLSPIVKENRGWALFISTPRGKNHFWRLLQTAQSTPGWYAEISTAMMTGVFTAQELQEELHQLQDLHGDSYGQSLWSQEYGCSFDAAIPGAIWADSIDRLQLAGRICDFTHNRHAPVFTGWDLGRTDDTAIWFYQFNGQEIDVLDYWAGNNCEIYAPEVPEKSLVHILLRKSEEQGYKYATHWVPHDARPRRLGMGGKSILQQFHDATKLHPSLGRFAVAPRLDVQEGIQAARKTFQSCRFHASRCAPGIELLRHYHREWDTEKKMFLDHPVHDFSSHCADAMRTMAVTWKASKLEAPEEPASFVVKTTPITWGAIRKAHFDRMEALREGWN